MNRYIKTQIKIARHEQDISFIKKCLNNETLPPFSRIKLATTNNKQFINDIRSQITHKELNNKLKNKKKLEKSLHETQNSISDLSTEHWTELQTVVEAKVAHVIETKKQIHARKLEKLGITTTHVVDSKFVNKRRNNIEKIEELSNKQSIFNYSSKILSAIETRILEKGLKYGIKNKKVDKYEILARFEQLAQTLNKLEINNTDDERKTVLDKKSAFLHELQSMAFEFIELSRDAKDNLTDQEHRALEELAKDKSIIISKADKGNAVVIQNKEDYIKKVQEILDDDEKFEKLKENETIKRETRLQNYLRQLAKTKEDTSKTKITTDVYKRILPSGSRAGIMYGLPKIHKKGVPLRPIISAIKTYNYNLAKYLDEILKPLINSPYIIKDTFDFVNKVSHLASNSGEHMVSFDIVSLFTNIPTLETIEIILSRAFKDNTLFHGLDREALRKLLIICTQESHFQFNGQFYDQKDGVAMGSPLGPLFANIFMDEFEQKHMDQLKELGITTWMRYVDDVFSLLTDKSKLSQILEFINEQHPNIKFTTEIEVGNKIPFLDTCVTRRANGYSTKMYHKPTFTGVYLNWTSLTSRKYKISLIYCLCDRIWKICQNQDEREAEFNKLKQTLLRNEYPAHIIDKEIAKYISNRSINTSQTQTEQLENIEQEDDDREPINDRNQNELDNTRLFEELPKQQQPTREKQKRYIVLPYSNHKVDEFAGRLTRLVNDNFEQVDLKIAFKAPNEIGKMFPFKDNIKDNSLQSLVVYRIRCETCNREYIGKTERILAHRIKEHNNPKGESAIQTHKREYPTHSIDASNIEILDKADNNFKLMLKEMLHINTHKPELNTQHAASYKKLNNKDMFKYQLNTIIIARQA